MSKFDEYSGLFNSSFDIPENYTLGLAFAPTSDVKVLLDYQRINYNKVKAIGASTSNLLNCGQGQIAQMGGQDVNSCLGGSNGPGFGWQNINVIKLGVEWRQTAALTLRAGFNKSDNPVKSEDVTFNIMAPGIMTKHYTLGGTYALDKEREVTLAYMYAPENSVTGKNLFNPAGTDTVRMKQQSLGIQYAWKF